MCLIAFSPPIRSCAREQALEIELKRHNHRAFTWNCIGENAQG